MKMTELLLLKVYPFATTLLVFCTYIFENTFRGDDICIEIIVSFLYEG